MKGFFKIKKKKKSHICKIELIILKRVSKDSELDKKIHFLRLEIHVEIKGDSIFKLS